MVWNCVKTLNEQDCTIEYRFLGFQYTLAAQKSPRNWQNWDLPYRSSIRNHSVQLVRKLLNIGCKRNKSTRKVIYATLTLKLRNPRLCSEILSRIATILATICTSLCRNRFIILTAFLQGHCGHGKQLKRIGLTSQDARRFCNNGEEPPTHLQSCSPGKSTLPKPLALMSFPECNYIQRFLHCRASQLNQFCDSVAISPRIIHSINGQLQQENLSYNMAVIVRTQRIQVKCSAA